MKIIEVDGGEETIRVEPGIQIPVPDRVPASIPTGGDSGVDANPPAIEGRKQMRGAAKRSKSLDPREKFVKKLTRIKKQAAQRQRVPGEPRERGGASVPCPLCAGPTRVVATRRSGYERLWGPRTGDNVWPGELGDVFRTRACKNPKCNQNEFDTLEKVIQKEAELRIRPNTDEC